MENIYKNIFEEAGLNDNEAVVYEFLIKNGEVSAGKIIENTPLKRGVVYNALATLIEKNLIKEKDKNKVSKFTPEHPNHLEKFIENEENKIKKAKNNLKANFDSILSDFNLVLGKPGVKFLEGEKAMQEVLEDSLKDNKEIRLIINSSKVESSENFNKINNFYVKKRKKLGVIKKIIDVDTKEIREAYAKMDKDYKEITQVKFIKEEKFSSLAAMQIYKNKISYQIFKKDSLISFLIQDENIYQMQIMMFDTIWDILD